MQKEIEDAISLFQITEKEFRRAAYEATQSVARSVRFFAARGVANDLGISETKVRARMRVPRSRNKDALTSYLLALTYDFPIALFNPKESGSGVTYGKGRYAYKRFIRPSRFSRLSEQVFRGRKDGGMTVDRLEMHSALERQFSIQMRQVEKVFFRDLKRRLERIPRLREYWGR